MQSTNHTALINKMKEQRKATKTRSREMGRYCLFIIVLLHMLFGIFGDLGVAGKEECSESTRCGYYEPAIRFPFYLKDRQPDHCGYPGFDLYCNHNNKTMIQLPSTVKLLVKNIDYKSQEIQVYDPNNCNQRQLLYLNLSASPFKLKSDHLINYTFVNCSSEVSGHYVSCFGYSVRAVPSDSFVFNYDLLNCSKIPNISSIPLSIDLYLDSYILQLNWSKQILCGDCEARGQKCRRRKNSSNTEPEIECFDKPGSTARGVVAGSILGFFLLVIIIIALYEAHSFDKREKENQVKIEKFLENYIAFKPTRYSYDDIKRITNQFKDTLGQGGYGTVFKGKLSTEFLVAVKILHNVTGNGEEFINEVGTMSTIHHINVVRLVGFCAEGSKRALIYEFLPNESLEKFIFLADGNKRLLGWEKLQDIAIGIAKGIEYLHQGCDQRILHFDIKPHNILLDDNFNPKISDFGLAKLCSKGQSAISMTAARGTMGYIAPEVLSRNFGNVSYKSDVYSFGMVLLEMVGGRKNIDARVENTSQVYFPEWIYDRLDQGEELRIRIEEEGDADIAKKLTIVGLWCIQWYPADRPSMKVVLQMLEGDVNNLTTPPNPFVSAIQKNSTGIMPERHFRKELAVIPESN